MVAFTGIHEDVSVVEVRSAANLDPLPRLLRERIDRRDKRRKPLLATKQANPDAFADVSEGWTGADIEALCKRVIIRLVAD